MHLCSRQLFSMPGSKGLWFKFTSQLFQEDFKGTCIVESSSCHYNTPVLTPTLCHCPFHTTFSTRITPQCPYSIFLLLLNKTCAVLLSAGLVRLAHAIPFRGGKYCGGCIGGGLQAWAKPPWLLWLYVWALPRVWTWLRQSGASTTRGPATERKGCEQLA